MFKFFYTHPDKTVWHEVYPYLTGSIKTIFPPVVVGAVPLEVLTAHHAGTYSFTLNKQ